MKESTPARTRRGRVDAVPTLAIVGLAVAMLLPAVQAARAGRPGVVVGSVVDIEPVLPWRPGSVVAVWWFQERPAH